MMKGTDENSFVPDDPPKPTEPQVTELEENFKKAGIAGATLLGAGALVGAAVNIKRVMTDSVTTNKERTAHNGQKQKIKSLAGQFEEVDKRFYPPGGFREEVTPELIEQFKSLLKSVKSSNEAYANEYPEDKHNPLVFSARLKGNQDFLVNLERNAQSQFKSKHIT